jgi:hypothetical protein
MSFEDYQKGMQLCLSNQPVAYDLWKTYASQVDTFACIQNKSDWRDDDFLCDAVRRNVPGALVGLLALELKKRNYEKVLRMKSRVEYNCSYLLRDMDAYTTNLLKKSHEFLESAAVSHS